MNETNTPPPDNRAANRFQQVDPITAGDAVLARARSVAQQITERVRQLTEGSSLDAPGDSADGALPSMG